MTRIAFIIATAATLIVSPAIPQSASANLIQNGNFAQTVSAAGGSYTGAAVSAATGAGEYYTGTGTSPYAGVTQAVGWNACATAACNANDGGYPFLFVAAPSVVDTTGFPDPFDHTNGQNGTPGYNRYIWGPGDGAPTTNKFSGTAPAGGNVLLMDADFHRTAISQNVSGLIVGATYAVSFWWSAAQFTDGQGSFTSPTTESVSVSLGGQTFNTATVTNLGQGFYGWMQQVYSFTYDGTSNALTFLASGTPSGEPPMVMLNGVSMTYVPEPATWALLVAGIVGTVALARRRRAAA